jgi:alpha-tubulin suppressor-like RCC1 family protein
MLPRKTPLIAIVLSFLVSNVGLAGMCARLKDVSAGENHSMALMDDNTLWACGDNSSWQLGLGNGVYEVYSLKQVRGEGGNGFLRNIVTYDAGVTHSLAADVNGTILAWGDDYHGQLGNGTGNDPCEYPAKVSGVGGSGYLSDTVDIVYVSSGRSGYHSLAVDSNGYVYSFGYNYYGQCGDGTSGTQNQTKQTPVRVLDDNPQTTGVYLGDITHIIAVDAGVNHSIALDANGFVWEWGQNNGYSYPRKVPNYSGGGGGYLRYIVSIATCNHSVAVDSNGFVYVWQYGTPYKVTDGEMYTSSGYLENIVEVSAGNGYSMARTSDGHVLVWNSGGEPEYVQDGEMKTQSGLLEGITSISAGFYSHKLAVCENGYGWALGSNSSGELGIGDTTNRTNPTQMLCAEVSSSIYLIKTSEIQGLEPNCAKPFIGWGLDDNYLVYEICYGNPITNPSDPNYYGSVYEVNIIDHLPFEADFYSVTGGGVYDSDTHTVTWTIDELSPGETDCLTLTTKVNNYARPGSEISNFVEMTADMYYSNTSDTVPVCSWGSEIIYVDKDATGYNNGTNWNDAYTDLRDAFTGAQNLGADVTAIWVAAGTYKPIYDIGEDDAYKDATFELLEDVGLFGHFGGIGTYETSTNQRNFADANDETILEGKIGTSASEAVYYVIRGQNIEDAVVDGFTIRDSYSGAGIYLNNADVAIVNCKVKNNRTYGIQAENYSYPDVHNCTLIDNVSYGMYIYQSSRPEISYCIFDGNSTSAYGLYMSNYSVVSASDSIFKKHTSYGINGSSGTLTLTGATFDYNRYGIYLSDITTSVTDGSVKNSNYHGIYCSNSDLTVEKSVVANNGYNGLYMTSGCNLTLKNSVVRYNGYEGIDLSNNLTTTITNNWIHKNGMAHSVSNGASGIYLNNHTWSPLIRNNTIFDNWTYGIQMSENGGEPNITNCIIYGNDSNDLYRQNDDFEDVSYCNLQNPHTGNGNITGDPGFMNVGTDPNDLHIDETSQCKDAGDPNINYGAETDIDGEPRVIHGRADIGADEYYWSPADFDEDGKVNLIDYVMLLSAWRTDPNYADYNEICDLEDNNVIDFNDLDLFCEEWLWEKGTVQGWMMSMGGEGGDGGFDMESMALEASAVSLADSETTIAQAASDSLMLPTAQASLLARPERLVVKSQKFYDVTPANTISALQKAEEAKRPRIDKDVIKEMLEWLDEMWISGVFKEVMTEEEYLEFRKLVMESGNY